MLQAIKRFVREEDGVTALEYGLLAAGVAAAIIAFSDSLQGLFVTLIEKLTSAVGGGASNGGSGNGG